jgi:Tfp pilus assembly protein FimV
MTRLFPSLFLALTASLLAGPVGAADAPSAGSARAASASAATSAPRPAARESAPTRQALETLLGSLPPVRPQAEGPPRQRTTALRGETLDAAIRRTMGDMPFKESFLRGVFLEINAGAVQPGTTRLIAGAQLQVPHLEDLRSHLQRVLGPQMAGGAATAAPAEKRHWPRFP